MTATKRQKLTSVLALSLASLIVITNGLIGHYFAPNGISLTPVVLTITSSMICFGTKNIKVIPIALLTYLFVALNDIQ